MSKYKWLSPYDIMLEIIFRREHPAFKGESLEAGNMLAIQEFRASFARKTAHSFAYGILNLT